MKLEILPQKMALPQLAGTLDQNATSERVLYDHSKINSNK